MKTFWIIVSALCGIAAVVFVLRNDYDKAFIAAALGAVAWFLNYRTRLRETFSKDEAKTDTEEANTEIEDETDQET